jgi:DNA primase
MDSVAEIKMRLSIEQVVGWYCQLTKKGRTFVTLCPFHNDTHPSLQVSPDKGIAYCFACRKGGDIFSFYQEIEGVDFSQAIKDLAEKAGVTLPTRMATPTQKGEKQRARECVEAAHRFFQKNLPPSETACLYLKNRAIPGELVLDFELGYAPDSFSETYEHLLKEGFSRREIIAAGLAIQRDLGDGSAYDRFRHRLMFPIHDHQGNLVAFGGRTLKDDDAKYINSSEGILYRKSAVLFNLHRAKQAIREAGSVVIVEGYFDVLGCRIAGVANVVAQCGTALTEEHVQILSRYTERVILSLDSDRAGRDAAERNFMMLSRKNLEVLTVELGTKDPADAAFSDAAALAALFKTGARPYMEAVLFDISKENLSDPVQQRKSLQRLLPLLGSIESTVERERWVEAAAVTLRTTKTALADDLAREIKKPSTIPVEAPLPEGKDLFSKTELVLGLFLLHPRCRVLLSELIIPEEGFTLALYESLRSDAPLATEYKERAAILELFCEQHGFREWGDTLAQREIRRNCLYANRDILKHRKRQIAEKLLSARTEGKTADEALLTTQYQQVLALAKRAG